MVPEDHDGDQKDESDDSRDAEADAAVPGNLFHRLPPAIEWSCLCSIIGIFRRTGKRNRTGERKGPDGESRPASGC